MRLPKETARFETHLRRWTQLTRMIALNAPAPIMKRSVALLQMSLQELGSNEFAVMLAEHLPVYHKACALWEEWFAQNCHACAHMYLPERDFDDPEYEAQRQEVEECEDYSDLSFCGQYKNAAEVPYPKTCFQFKRKKTFSR